jgi:hypothetical protein
MKNGSKIQHSFVHEQSSSTQEDESLVLGSRRNFFAAAAMQVCLMGAAGSAMAAAEPTVYRSGKAPVVAGQKAKDKNDVKGTRKDPDFLRSVADCRSQCIITPGSDGYAKSKEDCLSECQDVCCTTYETCTFNIVPRI